MFHTRPLLALLLSLAVASTANAAAKEKFEKLFGAEVKRVNATPEATDDIELATQLLGAAQNTNDDPEMRELLCDYTYALAGRDPAGYATAVDAMKLLAQSDPEKKSAAEAKIMLLYQRGYERSTGDKKQAAGEQYLAFLIQEADAKLAEKDYNEAVNYLRRARTISIATKSPERDAVQAKLDYYAPLAIATSRIESAEKKVKANPWDKASRGVLVEGYLTDFDSPAKAKEHLDLGGDDTQKKMVPLALKPADTLSEKEMMDLAGFYEDLSKKGVPPTRIAMLQRSKGYYEAWLSMHSGEGVERAAAELSFKRVSESLEKLESEFGLAAKKADTPLAGDGKTIELLDYVDPMRDGQRGKWLRAGDTILCERGGFTDVPILRVPVKIEGAYNLKVKFVRDSGEGSFGVILPVGDGQVSFALALPPGGVAGLSNIKDQPAMTNETRKDVSLNNGKVYTLDINVKPDKDNGAEINITLDGKTYVDWKGKQTDLSLGQFIVLNDKASIGFSSYNAAIIVGSAKLKAMAGGKTEMLEKAVDDATKKATKDVKPAARDDARNDRQKQIEDFIRNRLNNQ